jgi:hypothetical protein
MNVGSEIPCVWQQPTLSSSFVSCLRVFLLNYNWGRSRDHLLFDLQCSLHALGDGKAISPNRNHGFTTAGIKCCARRAGDRRREGPERCKRLSQTHACRGRFCGQARSRGSLTSSSSKSPFAAPIITPRGRHSQHPSLHGEVAICSTLTVPYVIQKTVAKKGF